MQSDTEELTAQAEIRRESQAVIDNNLEAFSVKEGKKESETEKKDKLHQAVRALVFKALKGFLTLTNEGKVEYSEKFINSIGFDEVKFKKFLDSMDKSKKFPYLKPEKDPREPRYKKSEEDPSFRVIDYCAENTIYIWNVNHAEFG